MNQKFNEPNNFIILYDLLGHPRSIMMRILIENSHGHLLKNQKILQFKKNPRVLLVLKANWLLDHHKLKLGLNPQDF
jgi:hypothetical protein